MRQTSHLISYWTVLLALCKGHTILRSELDLPLDIVVKRTWYAILWTLLAVTLATAIAQPRWMAIAITNAPLHSWPLLVAWTVGFIIANPALYGFVRLYTLVNHVMTINIFKTRGQRLRLLNLETKLLSLTAPFSVIWVIYRIRPTLAIWLTIVIASYGVYLFGYGYHLIFHKTIWRGTLLFVESTVVSLFVVAIGALAVTVAVSVASLFILLLLRPFLHH